MPRMLSHTLERVLSLCVCKVGAFDRERLLALAAIVEAAPLTRLALVKVFLSHPRCPAYMSRLPFSPYLSGCILQLTN